MLPHVIMHMHHNVWTAKSEVCVPLAPFVNLFETRSSVVFEPRICNLNSYVSSTRPLFSDTTTTVTIALLFLLSLLLLLLLLLL